MNSPNEVQIIEYESVLRIKAHSNDILSIVERHLTSILNLQIPPQNFLIISQLDNQGYIEHILEPSAMTQEL